MSQIIYGRASIREQTIWPSFLYGMPGVENTKTIIFGLYANTYLLGHNYLEDIETEELQRLVDVYDSNMSQLDIEDQILVLEIVSKRYLKIIEIQIKNNALTTKTQQLNADRQEHEAKLSALDVDQKALETKRTQIELVRDRAELKNKDLEARIKLEELAQDYVAVETSQKQFEVARAESKVLTTAIKGLEIQIDVANTSLQIAQAEASKSQIDADIAGTSARIAELDLMQTRADLTQVELETLNEELTLDTARISLINARGSIVSSETAGVESIITQEEALKESQESVNSARTTATTTGHAESIIRSASRVTSTRGKNISEIAVGNEAMLSQIAIGNTRAEIPPKRTLAASTIKEAAINAAKTLATAKITTSLTHEIGSA